MVSSFTIVIKQLKIVIKLSSSFSNRLGFVYFLFVPFSKHKNWVIKNDLNCCWKILNVLCAGSDLQSTSDNPKMLLLFNHSDESPIFVFVSPYMYYMYEVFFFFTFLSSSRGSVDSDASLHLKVYNVWIAFRPSNEQNKQRQSEKKTSSKCIKSNFSFFSRLGQCMIFDDN